MLNEINNNLTEYIGKYNGYIPLISISFLLESYGIKTFNMFKNITEIENNFYETKKYDLTNYKLSIVVHRYNNYYFIDNIYLDKKKGV